MSAGKGSAYRRVDRAKWDAGYARAFGKCKKPKARTKRR